MSDYGVDDEDWPPGSYPVGLVGELNYQRAILDARPGDRVEVLHDIGNPYDDQALVAKTAGGATLGYVARDSWLRTAIHDEGQCCEAIIFAIHPGEHGAGVVVSVNVKPGEIGTCAFSR
jgi:hypothetical protein